MNEKYEIIVFTLKLNTLDLHHFIVLQSRYRYAGYNIPSFVFLSIHIPYLYLVFIFPPSMSVSLVLEF